MTAPAQTPFDSRAVPACFARRVSLSRAEVAETLGKSLRFVDTLIETGKLRTSKAGSSVLVLAVDVWALAGITVGKSRGSARARSLLRRIEA